MGLLRLKEEKNNNKSKEEVRNLFRYRPETILSGVEAHLAVWVLSACRLEFTEQY